MAYQGRKKRRSSAGGVHSRLAQGGSGANGPGLSGVSPSIPVGITDGAPINPPIDTSVAFNCTAADPCTYTATGLPPGTSIDPTTGVITGTPTTSGTYNVTVTATNSTGSTSTSFTIDVASSAAVPQFIGPIPDITAIQGGPITPINLAVYFTNPNNETRTFSISPSLIGVSIDPSTGVLSGTFVNQTNSPITVTATYPSTTLTSNTVNITVSPNNSPVFNGPIPDVDGVIGIPLNPVDMSVYFSDPDGEALTFSTLGALPAGLSLDAATGILSGTPLVATAQTVRIIAQDAAGASADSNFVAFNLVSNTLPVFNGPIPNYVGEVGVAITPLDLSTYFSDPEGYPLTYSVSTDTDPLPPGLTLDSATGIVSGTPTVAGSSPLGFRATDPGGAVRGSNVFYFTFGNAPVLTGPFNDLTATVGQPFTYDLSAHASDLDNNINSYQIASGYSLPAGLSLNTSTGIISGTPTAVVAPTPFSFVVYDTNNLSATSPVFNVEVAAPANTAPVFNGPIPDVVATVNQAMTPVDMSVYFSDPDGDPLTYSFPNGTQPSGVSIDPATGIVSGTPILQSNSTVNIRATDPAGAQVDASFTFIVNAPANPEKPVFSNTAPPDPITWNTIQDPKHNIAAYFTAAPGGTCPLRYTWGPAGTTLPAGLAMDQGTGEIYINPAAGSQNTGSFNIELYAYTNCTGSVIFSDPLVVNVLIT